MSHAADMLEKYIAAETAILEGQTIEWGDRKLTMADLAQIQAGRREWESRVAAERRGGRGYSLASFAGCGGREGSERWGRN